MTDSICEMLQTSTNLFHSNSINSNSTNNNNTVPTAYITELFALHKRGVSHDQYGYCLPNCVAYESKTVRHGEFGGLEFLTKTPFIPELLVHATIEPDTLPAKTVIQKKKNSGLLYNIRSLFLKIRGFVILKDYILREQLSPNERERLVKKVKKNISLHEKNISYYTKRRLTSNYEYAIEYYKAQLRLFLLQEQNPEKPPERPFNEYKSNYCRYWR